MSAAVIDLKNVEDQRDVVHRAVEALVDGQLVVFPTETVYGVAASALHEGAIQRLLEAKGRDARHPMTLAIKSAEDAWDYVPRISTLGQRLARRCWPGPLTLVLEDDHPESVVRQLPVAVQKVVCPAGQIGLRVPAHPILLSVLRLCAGPLALSSANRTGEPAAVTADEAIESLRDRVELILNDGQCKFGQPSTVVQIRDNCWQLLRPGVFNESTLRRLASFMLLFVCTGNTCRSPMAGALMQRHLARRLGVEEAQLEDRGLLVLSAGIAAMSGGRASAEAIEVMAECGLDLSRHESQPLSDRLVRFADLILTMTRGHREAILAEWSSAAARTHLLGGSAGDVADPVGGTTDTYRQCASQIDEFLKPWLAQLDLERIVATGGSGG
ncbi:MAG: threonylcarbamoyl-AMP synthase [Planctomycetaceae bacterium]|nr:threonylcarbamoyl-AMP synthase [Planctomycetaceae bacterium]